MELINKDWHGQLLEVRRVLASRNEKGLKAYSSMFDADVLSYAHGDGVSRPHPYVIAKAMEEFLTPENGSVDDYLYLAEDQALLDMLTADFVHDGILFEIARNIALDNGSSALICHIMENIIKHNDIKRVCVPASLPSRSKEALEVACLEFLALIDAGQGVYHIEFILESLTGKPCLVEAHDRVGGDWIPELWYFITGIDLYREYILSITNNNYSFPEVKSNVKNQ